MCSSTRTAPARWLRAGVVALGFAFCLASVAQAAPVTFVFTGTVGNVVGGGATAGITIGMPVIGHYTFDGAATSDPNNCGIRSCSYPNSISSFSVGVPAASFSLSFGVGGSLIFVSENCFTMVGCTSHSYRAEATGVDGGFELDIWGQRVLDPTALPLVPPNLPPRTFLEVTLPSGDAFSARLTSLTLAVSATDYDGDGVLNNSDNCPVDVNPLQENADADLLGDVCDPFPNEADHAKAQCFVDLGTSNGLLFQSQLDLAQSQAGLAACQAQRVFADSDGDGEDNATDQCGSTPAGSPVDGDGCSVVQFCAPRAATCKRNDWMNDEPTSKKPGDCSYDKNLRSCR